MPPDDPSWRDTAELFKCLGVFYWENGKRIMELDEACDVVNFIHEEYVLISEGLRSLGGDFPEDLGGLPRHEFELWNPGMPMFAVDLVGVEWASDIHAVVVWGDESDHSWIMEAWRARKKRTLDEVATVLGAMPIADDREGDLSAWFSDLKLRGFRLDGRRH